MKTTTEQLKAELELATERYEQVKLTGSRDEKITAHGALTAAKSAYKWSASGARKKTH